MADGDDTFLRVKKRKVRTEVPGFMRVTSYKFAYRWAGEDPKNPAWVEEEVERVDVYRRDAVSGLLHLAKGDQHTLILVKQFRLSTAIDPETGDPDFSRDGAFVELMAGVRERDEPPLETLIRETREESGFEIDPGSITSIASFYPSPGACSERIYLYYARVTPDAAIEARKTWGVSGHENILREDMAPADFLRDVEAGKMLDAKTIIAAGWLRQNYERLFGAPPPPLPAPKTRDA